MIASLARVLGYVLIFAIMMPLGITWHEVMGHGLVGVLCGGRVTRLQVWDSSCRRSAASPGSTRVSAPATSTVSTAMSRAAS
jgi:hypothetical protein